LVHNTTNLIFSIQTKRARFFLQPTVHNFGLYLFLTWSFYLTRFVPFLEFIILLSTRLWSFSFTIEVKTNDSFAFKFLWFSNRTMICNNVFFSIFLIYNIWKRFYTVLVSIIWFKSVLKVYIKIWFVILISIVNILTSF